MHGRIVPPGDGEAVQLLDGGVHNQAVDAPGDGSHRSEVEGIGDDELGGPDLIHAPGPAHDLVVGRDRGVADGASGGEPGPSEAGHFVFDDEGPQSPACEQADLHPGAIPLVNVEGSDVPAQGGVGAGPPHD